MSISYHIDPHRRVVFAAGHGTFNDRDVFAYQHDVWSRPELAGYDELIDMRDVERIDPPSSRASRIWRPPRRKWIHPPSHPGSRS